jgi:hypothetical protein
MKLRRVRFASAPSLLELAFHVFAYRVVPAPALFLFVLAWFHLSHLCSICLFDCRRQEAVAAHQGPRPHAHQALKVDRQEVSLRQRMSRSLLTFTLSFAVSILCVVFVHVVNMAIFVFFSTLDSCDSSQGTNTFDRYEMRIYKRVIDFDTSVETIRTLVRHSCALLLTLAMHANFTICLC